MEKRIVTVSYWLGLLSALIAVVLRALNAFGLLSPTVVQKSSTIWYLTFYRGALLFFLITIATALYAQMCEEKT